MKSKSKVWSPSLEAAIVGASTLMEMEQALDSKSPEYVQGFIDGFGSCLQSSERFDAINREKRTGVSLPILD